MMARGPSGAILSARRWQEANRVLHSVLQAWRTLKRYATARGAGKNFPAKTQTHCGMIMQAIKTSRLFLRPFTPADVDEIHQLWSAPGVRKYLWDDEIIPKETAQEVVAKSIELFHEKGLGLWAVTFHKQSAIIGFCGYWYFHEPPELEILYGIAPEHWGNNLATEAARAMLQYGFQYLGFDEISASADAPNAASFRVMEKTGMKFLKRESKNGRDTIFHAISKNDFRVDEPVQIIAPEAYKQK